MTPTPVPDPESATADELVQGIFIRLQSINPDADPGDIDIDVQDDMPVVNVHAGSVWLSMGYNIQSALVAAYAASALIEQIIDRQGGSTRDFLPLVVCPLPESDEVILQYAKDITRAQDDTDE